MYSAQCPMIIVKTSVCLQKQIYKLHFHANYSMSKPSDSCKLRKDTRSIVHQTPYTLKKKKNHGLLYVRLLGAYMA